MTITTQMNEEEVAAVRAFAELHGTTVSDVMRRAILEKIEDEHDLQLWRDAYAAYQANPSTLTHEELMKELGLK